VLVLAASGLRTFDYYLLSQSVSWITGEECNSFSGSSIPSGTVCAVVETAFATLLMELWKIMVLTVKQRFASHE
jgi:hypothetical protein